MFAKRHEKLRRAVWAVAPVGCALAGGLLGPDTAQAVTWTGTNGSFFDSSWAGSPNPPTTGLIDGTPFTATPPTTPTSGTWPVVFIGNNASVTFNGGTQTIGINMLRVGFAGGLPALSVNSGTAVFSIDSGTLLIDQNPVVGDGAAGTLNITGGQVVMKETKHFYLGALSDGQINMSGGTLALSRYGIENGAGVSTFNMTGGVVEYWGWNLPAPIGNQIKQIQADYFRFTGGWLGGQAGIRSTTTINEVSGSGSISLHASSAAAITFDLNTDSVWNGFVGSGTTALGIGSGTLIKTGPAALTLTAVQGYHGSTTANGGTLILDYATNPELLQNDSTITMGGGVLRLKANASGATSETVNRLQFSQGGSTVIMDKNGGSGITLVANTTALNRTVGATADFIAAGGGVLGTDANINVSSTGTAGIIGGYATVNNFSEWASNVSGSIAPAPGSVYAPDADLGAAVSTPTSNLKPSGAQTDVTNAGTFNSIHLTGAVGINMTGAGSLGLVTGGLLADTTGSVTGGTLTAVLPASPSATGIAGADVVVTTVQNLSMSSVIVDNGGSIGLTKNGPAILTLSGTQQYAGGTSIARGTLRISGNDVLPTNTGLVLSNTPGAVFDLNGSSQRVKALFGGGTAGGEVKLGSGVLSIADGFGTFSTQYDGIITGAGGVTKLAGGTATLTNPNSSYTGVTTVQDSSVLAVAKLSNGGANSSIGAASSAASNIVLDNGTLQFVGRSSNSTNRLFSVGPNGATIDAAGSPGNGGSAGFGGYGAMNFTGPGVIGMTGSPSGRSLTFNAGSFGNTNPMLNPLENNFNAVIPDSGAGNSTTVRKTGVGVWALNGSNTYTGNTELRGGALHATDGVGIPSASLLLFDGGLLQTSGTFTRTIGTSAGNAQLNGATAGFVANPGSSLSVNFGGAGAGLQWGVGAFNPGTLELDDGVTLVNPIDFHDGGAQRIFSTVSGVATISGAVSNSQFTGGGGLFKVGGGLLVLKGTNTYGGSTTISAGVLRAAEGVGIPANTNLASDGGIFETSTNVTRPLFTDSNLTGQVIIGNSTAAGFSAFGAPISVDIGGNGSGTGPALAWGNGSFNPTTFTLNAGSADSTLTWRNAIDLNSTATPRTISAGAATAVMTGVISNSAGGGGTFNKAGGGVLQLTAVNTFATVINLQGGTFSVNTLGDGSVASAMGQASNAASNLLFSGGALQYTGPATSTDRQFTLVAGGVIDASGSGAINFTNVASPQFPSVPGNRTLVLSGSNVSDNTMSALLVDPPSSKLALAKSGSGKWVIPGNNTNTGGTSVAGGVLQFQTRIPNGPVSVTGGTLKVAAKGTPNSAAGTSVIPSFSSTGGATDLTNNSMIIDYTGPVGTQVSDIRGHLKNLRLITSSGTTTTRLGYGDNAVLGKTTFAGQSVDSSSILIKYTYAGDADLDGDADGVDIGTWATNFTGELGGAGSAVWTQGDWDYDGDVDGVDAGLWAQAFTGELGGGGLGDIVVNDPTIAPGAAAILRGMGITVVPEPATVGLLAGLGAIAMNCGRRSRRRK